MRQKKQVNHIQINLAEKVVVKVIHQKIGLRVPVNRIPLHRAQKVKVIPAHHLEVVPDQKVRLREEVLDPAANQVDLAVIHLGAVRDPVAAGQEVLEVVEVVVEVVGAENNENNYHFSTISSF